MCVERGLLRAVMSSRFGFPILRHSFSTCWNSDRHQQGEPLLREILDLGFSRVELGHGTRVSLLDGIRAMVAEGKVEVASVHNFCPLPVEVRGSAPDCYEFTSHRVSDRERALKLSYRTIDFAVEVGAHFVVLHLGTIPLRKDSDRLAKIVAAGGIYSREFVKAKLEAVQGRAKAAPRYFDRAREALGHLVEYAAARNVHLAVESRQQYEQVPTESEMITLLDEMDSPWLGYWHDFGHVQIKENLALLDHADWLAKIRHRLFGCHFHDVRWPDRDHQPPLTGMIAYEKLIPLLPDNCLCVWEMSPRKEAAEIQAAREAWRNRFEP